uniref:Uncharacterized protein n=1 Tax=Quercus lobata TaxID=97700 RepID=A0A7N2MN86_QUELO
MRSYYRKKENEGKVSEAEVSESSCVELNSEVDAGVFVERSSKLKSKSGKLRLRLVQCKSNSECKMNVGESELCRNKRTLSEIMEEIEGNEGFEAVSKSEISFVEEVSDGILNFSDGNVKANSEFNENEVISIASTAKLVKEVTEQVENRASEFSFP